MNIRNLMGSVMGLVMVATFAGADSVNINGITMDFVDILKPGNAANTDGYGAVGYNYRIGTCEVTYDQFAASGIGDGDENYWVGTVGSGAPVARINWNEAAMFANWLTSGNINDGAYTLTGGVVTGIDRAAAMATYGTVYAMPTEDEWYKAAYYNMLTESYHTYANSTDTQPGMNTDARYGNVLADGPWAVGSGAVELNGTCDMMGNMFEQLETTEGGDVVYRGGGYFQPEANLQSSWRTTDVKDPNPDYYVVGMRIVAIPEPGTISLMSLSTVGLFLTRSMRRRKRLGQTVVPIRREHLCDAFCSEQEWRAGNDAADMESDYVQFMVDAVKEACISSWTFIRKGYKEFDKAFWNRMVAVHERKVERRVAFRASFRKKALDSFDAFLAKIMK